MANNSLNLVSWFLERDIPCTIHLSLVRLSVLQFTNTLNLTEWCVYWLVFLCYSDYCLHWNKSFASFVLSVSYCTYFYKVLTYVICYISGETDATSGYDYLWFKNNQQKRQQKLVMSKLFTLKDSNRRPAAALVVRAIIPRRLSSAERWTGELLLLSEACFLL